MKKAILLLTAFLLITFSWAGFCGYAQAGTNVDLTSPQGGESWVAGSQHAITWTSAEKAEQVGLYYSTDSGTNWTAISESLEDTGSYTWKVPSTLTTKARVKIVWAKTELVEVSLPGLPQQKIPSPVIDEDISGDFKITASLIRPPVVLPPINLSPAAPSDLNVDSVLFTEAELSWKDNSSNETGFKLERKTSGGTYAQIATSAADAESYTDKDLDPGTTYYYRVKAAGSLGDSGYSNELKVVTAEMPVIPPVNPPTEPPVIPSTTQVIIKLYINSTEYYVNDLLKFMDTSPIILEGRTFLPIRYIAEPLGADVKWDGAQQKVTVTMNGKVIELWIGKSTARINGIETRIDPTNDKVTPVIVPPGRTMLPLRFIAENLDCKVDWNGETKEVKITYPKP